MGKGDKKSRKGKIFRGSYGVSRQKTGNKKRYVPESTGTGNKTAAKKKATGK